jgi:hypothetical protein
LLATTHDEATRATERVSILGDQFVTTRQAKDAVEEKILSLVSEVALANQRQEVAEEQCECLVHELTLLSIRGSELCITITGAPPLTPLHKGMHFAAAQHTEVATWLSALWAVVSLAAQSILERLPVDAPQAGVVGDIVVWSRERVDWYSRLEAAGQEICDLVLGLAGDQTRLIAHLEEATGRLRVMRGDQGGLEGSAPWACAPALGAAGEVPPLAVALSPSMSLELTESRVDVTAVNGVQWGA